LIQNSDISNFLPINKENEEKAIAFLIQNKKEKVIEEKPPVLSSWNQIYSVVIINLIVLILLFYFITNYFG